MWQNLIVAIIVLAATLSAAWKLAPARVRLRVLQRLPGGRLIARRTATMLATGCGACSHNHARPPH